jgi:hypothetical protein
MEGQAVLTPEFEALSREAGIAASAISEGVSGISNATYAEKGYYHFAFFNLSIAIERLGKLAFILDHLLGNGRYPTDAELRTLGHKLDDLIEKVREIRLRRSLSTEDCPTDDITRGIVETLTEFATATRYYNLDYLVGGRSVAMMEPLRAWDARVGKPILALHYKPRRRALDEEQARLVGALMDQISMVRHTAEDGTPITSWTAGAMETAKIGVLQKYSRMYCLRLIRFLAVNLMELQYEAMSQRHEIPHFGDFFGIFRNDDRYFLNRKTWNPYRP